MNTDAENKYGFLLLTDSGDGTSIYFKANKITSIMYASNGKLSLFDNHKYGMVVEEDIDEIFRQLENIHPSML